MADIELVIKIPEEDFEIMKHNITVNNPLCPLSEKEMVATIANGIPLPKGHGKLIDVDDLIQEFSVVSSRPIKSQLYILKEAPTIIEADKAESEEME